MLKVWEGRKDSRVSLWVLLDIYQKDRRPGKQINSVSCADVRHLDYNRVNSRQTQRQPEGRWRVLTPASHQVSHINWMSG